MTLKERYEKVINWFISTNAPSLPELKFSDNFSLLVAVMLSAQCTDKRVNMVTPILMTKYPNAESMSKASENELFSEILPTLQKHLNSPVCKYLPQTIYSFIIPENTCQIYL